MLSQTEARGTAACNPDEKLTSLSPAVTRDGDEQGIFSETIFPVVLSVPSEQVELQWSDLLLKCAKKISCSRRWMLRPCFAVPATNERVPWLSSIWI